MIRVSAIALSDLLDHFLHCFAVVLSSSPSNIYSPPVKPSEAVHRHSARLINDRGYEEKTIEDPVFWRGKRFESQFESLQRLMRSVDVRKTPDICRKLRRVHPT